MALSSVLAWELIGGGVGLKATGLEEGGIGRGAGLPGGGIGGG